MAPAMAHHPGKRGSLDQPDEIDAETVANSPDAATARTKTAIVAAMSGRRPVAMSSTIAWATATKPTNPSPDTSQGSRRPCPHQLADITRPAATTAMGTMRSRAIASRRPSQ